MQAIPSPGGRALEEQLDYVKSQYRCALYAGVAGTTVHCSCEVRLSSCAPILYGHARTYAQSVISVAVCSSSVSGEALTVLHVRACVRAYVLCPYVVAAVS